MWDEITYPFPNFNGYAVDVWGWVRNLSYTLLGLWLLIHAGIKVNHASKRGPKYQCPQTHILMARSTMPVSSIDLAVFTYDHNK